MITYLMFADNRALSYDTHIIDSENDLYSINFRNTETCLNRILDDIDCSIMYDCGPKCSTKYPIYHIHISKFMFLLNRIDNHILYNFYFDKLCKRHLNNLECEKIREVVVPTPKKKTTRKKKNIQSYKYNDLFDGKERVVDVDVETGEVISKKEKKTKAQRAAEKNLKKAKELNNKMTFSFNK